MTREFNLVTWARRPIVCICIMLLAGCAGKSTGGDIQAHINAARGYAQQGQFNAAMIEAKNVLQSDRQNEPATVLLATIYTRLGAPQAATSLLQHIHGSSEAYYEALAESYLKQGKFASALNLLNQHADAFKDNPSKLEIIRAGAKVGLKDFDAATSDYNKVLARQPDDVHAKLGLASVQLAKGNVKEAESAVEKILKKQPNQPDALILLGATYFRAGQLDLAESNLTKAVAALPTTDRFTARRASLIHMMISLLAYQGRSGEALVYQKMLAKAFPGAQEVNEKLATVDKQLQSGDFKKALGSLDAIDAISPGNNKAETLRGVVAYLQGNDELANRIFSKSVDPEIASDQTLRYFAANQIRLNRPHRVMQILQERVKGSQDPKLLALYGIAALSADRQKQGEVALRKAIHLAPKQGRLSVILASYLSNREPAAALKLLETAHANSLSDSSVSMALLSQYLNMGKTTDAGNLVRTVLKAEPKADSAHILAGTYYLRLGNLDKAAPEYQQASKLNPKNVDAAFGLGAVRLRQKNFDDAEQVFRSVIAKNAKSIPAYLELMQTYAARGAPEQGVKVLTGMSQDQSNNAPLIALASYYANLNQADEAEKFLQASKADSDSPWWKRTNAAIHVRQARESLAKGDFKRARRAVFTALSSYPQNEQLLSLLVQTEISSGSLTEAQKVVGQMASERPDAYLTLMRQGDLAQAAGKASQAKASYRKAWDQRGDDASAEGLYLAYQKLKDKQGASTFLDEWLKKLPDSLVANVNLAGAYVAEGKADAAIDIYTNLLKKHPDSGTLLNNLAWIYLQSNRVSDAVSTGKKAYNRMPDNGYVADTYGWALYKADRAQEAENVLKRAVTLASDPQIKAHLGTVQKSLAGTL